MLPARSEPVGGAGAVGPISGHLVRMANGVCFVGVKNATKAAERQDHQGLHGMMASVGASVRATPIPGGQLGGAIAAAKSSRISSSLIRRKGRPDNQLFSVMCHRQ